jgi:hypothetical protein
MIGCVLSAQKSFHMGLFLLVDAAGFVAGEGVLLRLLIGCRFGFVDVCQWLQSGVLSLLLSGKISLCSFT